MPFSCLVKRCYGIHLYAVVTALTRLLATVSLRISPDKGWINLPCGTAQELCVPEKVANYWDYSLCQNNPILTCTHAYKPYQFILEQITKIYVLQTTRAACIACFSV